MTRERVMPRRRTAVGDPREASGIENVRPGSSGRMRTVRHRNVSCHCGLRLSPRADDEVRPGLSAFYRLLRDRMQILLAYGVKGIGFPDGH